MFAVAPAYSTLRYFTPGNSRDSPSSVLKVSVLGFRAWNPPVLSRKYDEIWGRLRALTPEKSQRELDDSPVSVQLEPISGESHFDRVVADEQSMATWCRKCTYLKPKVEKMAAEYYPRLRFYSVDVNSVPHKLVTRADVTKMPTIQLWKDGKKQAEVIGGHGKAYLVINEVHAMIER